MKQIKLSQQGRKNKGKYVVLVDDWNYEYLNQWNWNVYTNGSIHYARRMESNGIKRVAIYMHRVIMNTLDNMEVDHIDHDGLNCQEFNLRNVTHVQNQMNRKTWGKSKYKGVSFAKIKLKNRYALYAQAKIKVENKIVQLGQFKTETAAALAYNTAAKKYFGEYANLNIIN